MTQITSRLAAFGLALILIGIPVPGQANEGAMDDTFIDIEDQKLVAEKLHYLWNTEAVYGQSQASERSADFVRAGTAFADEATIEFLEENVVNLWDHPELMAEYGINGEPTAGYAEKDLLLDWHRIRFLEENLWDYDGVAQFAQTEPDNFFPESDDVPQLRAGEVNY